MTRWPASETQAEADRDWYNASPIRGAVYGLALEVLACVLVGIAWGLIVVAQMVK